MRFYLDIEEKDEQGNTRLVLSKDQFIDKDVIIVTSDREITLKVGSIEWLLYEAIKELQDLYKN